MPTIALTMIVRDEEAMLPACLASVRGIVDEIVIVDTGSRDATIAIARAAGARVVEQPWADDFSAPRNRAIAESHSEWVLVLDADERLTRSAGDALKRAILANDFDCGMLPLHNATRVDAEVEGVARGAARVGDAAYLPRLFRRTADLRYTGIVHENVGEWLFQGDRRPKLLPGVDIVHLGAVPDVRQQRDKRRRNIDLLERACAERPDDVTSFGYLAHEYLEASERDKARQVADRGWAVFLKGGLTLDLPVLRLATARAWLAVQVGEGDVARETLEVASRSVADHPDLHFLFGCVAETDALRASDRGRRRARLEEAQAAYERALACAGRIFLQKFVQGGSGFAAETRLGTVRLLLGRPADALAAFDRALSSHPEARGSEPTAAASLREARWGKVEASLALGDPRGALREVQAALDDRPDGWTLAALAAEAAGSLDAMRQWLGKAQASLDAGFVAPHRRERYHDALVAFGLYTEQRVDAPGPLGDVARLAFGRAENAEPSPRGLEDPIVSGMVERMVRHWLSRGRGELVERLVAPGAAVLLPGLVELTADVVDDLTKARSVVGSGP